MGKRRLDIHANNQEITMEENINSHRSQVQALNENNNAQDTEEIDKLDMENRAIKIGIGRELMKNQHDRFKSRRQHSHAHIGRAGPKGLDRHGQNQRYWNARIGR
mgnify:CR=1 FL=1